MPQLQLRDWNGAKGRFDGYIAATWHNLNADGGSPTPMVTSERNRFRVAGGFEFAKGVRSGAGSIDIEIVEGEGFTATVTVKIVAQGSFPSFELHGSGPFDESNDPTTRLRRRVFTLDTPHGKAEVKESYFPASLRWYEGVEFVFHPPHGATVSVIFEKITEGGELGASTGREEDPRPSPFDDAA